MEGERDGRRKRERVRYRLGLKIYGSKFLDSKGSQRFHGFQGYGYGHCYGHCQGHCQDQDQGSGFRSRERSGRRSPYPIPIPSPPPWEGVEVKVTEARRLEREGRGERRRKGRGEEDVQGGLFWPLRPRVAAPHVFQLLNSIF